ncbi:MAG: hypothetical protein WC285_04110, partial [Candidatus Gracilibacteria bacterium]
LLRNVRSGNQWERENCGDVRADLAKYEPLYSQDPFASIVRERNRLLEAAGVQEEGGKPVVKWTRGTFGGMNVTRNSKQPRNWRTGKQNPGRTP